LIDVAPTILQFLGAPEPPQFQGQSLLGLLGRTGQHSPREVYSESLYAHQHWGCGTLRSLRVGDYKFINAPEPELYDLRADPAEQSNLNARSNSLVIAYRERLQQLRTRFASSNRPQPGGVSPEVARALSSLGYVAATASHVPDTESGFDPKKKLDEYLRAQDATSLAFAGQWQQAVEMLKQVLAKDPELIDTRNLLGQFQQKLGAHEEAAGNFRKVLERDPYNLTSHYNLGVEYFQLQRFDEAARELQATLTIGSARGKAAEQFTRPSEEMLGKIWMEKGDLARARKQFNHLLSEFPQDFAAHYNLGWLADQDGNWEEASRQLQTALEVEPNNSLGHYALGMVHFQKGDLAEARTQFSLAIKVDPLFTQAHYDLGRVLSQSNMRDEAAREFKKALEVDPKFFPAQRALEELQHGG
jgi:tetratricopeptide (TPR) repeat protein